MIAVVMCQQTWKRPSDCLIPSRLDRFDLMAYWWQMLLLLAVVSLIVVSFECLPRSSCSVLIENELIINLIKFHSIVERLTLPLSWDLKCHDYWDERREERDRLFIIIHSLNSLNKSFN